MPFLSLGLLDHEKPNLAAAEEASTELGLQNKPESNLPPGIEELRQKLSDRSAVSPVVTPLVASVDALSSSERYGVPTFSTFKFGYLPRRGLLYSTIAHEIAVFALFLIFSYGLPVLRPQKLVVRLNTQDYLVYLPEVGGGSEGQ